MPNAILLVELKHGSVTFRIPQDVLHRILLAADLKFRDQRQSPEPDTDAKAKEMIKEIRSIMREGGGLFDYALNE